MFAKAEAEAIAEQEDLEKFVEQNGWSIRPCFLYKEEYNECTSIRGRFHQYFINGETIDCSQWKRDYNSCTQFEDTRRAQFAKAILDSEAQRRKERLNAHYANTIWSKRQTPPDDWAKPLPEWLQKKNENSFLAVKAQEMKDGNGNVIENRTLCVIM